MTDQDPWDDASAKAWINFVIEEMVPKLSSSAMALSIVPDGDQWAAGDVKYWVELGASIMMDKPIIALVMNDRPIPPKLELVADELVRLPDGLGPEANDLIAAALERVAAKLGPENG